MSQSLVAQVEAGDVGRMALDTLERVAGVLEIRLELRGRWRGGELDRQLSARHAALSESVARALRSAGWTVVPQASVSIWGERGIVDILAWHEPTRSLLVIEVKTEIVDVEETVGTLDRKRRLAVEVAAERGWRARTVGVWLIVADGSTNRRRVAAHGTLLRSAFPLYGWAMRRWLQQPSGAAVAGLSFWSDTSGGGVRRSLAARKRVRLPRSSLGQAERGPDRSSRPPSSAKASA